MTSIVHSHWVRTALLAIALVAIAGCDEVESRLDASRKQKVAVQLVVAYSTHCASTAMQNKPMLVSTELFLTGRGGEFESLRSHLDLEGADAVASLRSESKLDGGQISAWLGNASVSGEHVASDFPTIAGSLKPDMSDTTSLYYELVSACTKLIPALPEGF